jgi:hypothetical protein
MPYLPPQESRDLAREGLEHSPHGERKRERALRLVSVEFLQGPPEFLTYILQGAPVLLLPAPHDAEEIPQTRGGTRQLLFCPGGTEGSFPQSPGPKRLEDQHPDSNPAEVHRA